MCTFKKCDSPPEFLIVTQESYKRKITQFSVSMIVNEKNLTYTISLYTFYLSKKNSREMYSTAVDLADGLLNNDELDFLNDLLGEDDKQISISLQSSKSGKGLLSNPLNYAPRSPVRSGTASKKCAELYLGGTDLKPGMNDFVGDAHFCNNMQCFCCDHIVLRFPDRRWSKDTDYMFLRNNYPNNLDSKLIPAPGWCAFCCQCMYREDKEIQRLKPYSSNWVCRGHT